MKRVGPHRRLKRSERPLGQREWRFCVWGGRSGWTWVGSAEDRFYAAREGERALWCQPPLLVVARQFTAAVEAIGSDLIVEAFVFEDLMAEVSSDAPTGTVAAAGLWERLVERAFETLEVSDGAWREEG